MPNRKALVSHDESGRNFERDVGAKVTGRHPKRKQLKASLKDAKNTQQQNDGLLRVKAKQR